MRTKKYILAALLVVFALASVNAIFTYNKGAGIYIYQDKAVEPGTVLWVNSSTGSDSAGCGKTPDRPCDTVDYAIGLCTANKGDVIYVMAGHSEEGASATQFFDADVAGVSIIGLGTGQDRPRFDFNYADSKISIGAANVTLRNLVFRPGVTSTTVGVDIEVGGDNALIEGCEFAIGEASGTDEFVSAIVLNSGANDVTILRNVFYTAITDNGCVSAINLGVAGAVARTAILNNYGYGNWSTAFVIDGGTNVTELLIANNRTKVKDAEPCIELNNGTTGVIADNVCDSTTGTVDALIVAATASWIHNYGCVTDGAACQLIGSDENALQATLLLVGATVDDIEAALTLVGATVDDIEAALLLVGATVDDTEAALALVGATVDDTEAALTLVGATVDDIETKVDTAALLGNTIYSAVTLIGATVDDIETKVDTGNLMGDTIYDIVNNGVGTTFLVTVTVAAGASVVSGGLVLTGAASGTLLLESVVLQNGATALDSSAHNAVMEFYSDNVYGSATFWDTTDPVTAADVIASGYSTENNDAGQSPLLVLESGKKIKVKATGEDFTAGGTFRVHMIFRRMSAGATIASR